MAKISQASRFWTYIAECLRLLYWSYFKPFSWQSWRYKIHPKLEDRNNHPYAMRAEFPNNPRLRRYAEQIWWLNATVPLLAILLVVPVGSLVTSKPFNLIPSCIFFVGYLVSLLLMRTSPTRLRRWLYISYVLGQLLLSLVLLLVVFFAPEVLTEFDTTDAHWRLLFGGLLGVIISNVENLPWGLTFIVAYSVGLGLAGGVAWNVVLGIAFGLALSTGWGWSKWVNLAIYVIGGVMYGVLQGMTTESVVVGVAFVVPFLLGFLRVYFWLPELLLMFALSKFAKRENCSRWLRYLPPRFDQLIILPLPLMKQLIVEAYRENPVAALETINYLITSTNQQKLAASAIADIAVDSLSHCQRLSNIVAISKQLAWIPSPPPKDLGSILPQLLNISQDVRGSVEATSPYRQSELLNPPITALRELLNRLTFCKNARLATTFGSIAQRWLTILETAQRTLEEQGRYSKEIRQVYIAGNALDPQTAKNRFKGRIDLFREIETLALAEQPRVLLLYGGRRTGKTSALKYLPHRVGANLVPLLVDVQAAASTTTLPGLAENLATQIIEAARRLPQHLDLSYPDKNKLAQDPFSALQEWLAEIEWTVPSKRFLLCLDEFERLSELVEVTGSRTPLNFLRHVLQHNTSWTLLLSGSHEPQELPDYWSDYLINTRTLRVSYLDEDSARELIVQPVEDFTNIYDRTAIDCHYPPHSLPALSRPVNLLRGSRTAQPRYPGKQARRQYRKSHCTRCRDSYSYRARARRRVFPGIVEKSDG
jgi:AAA+ ATPase superfamily predicted ATPase